MKTRMLYVVLSAAVVFASLGGKLAELLTWADGA